MAMRDTVSLGPISGPRGPAIGPKHQQNQHKSDAHQVNFEKRSLRRNGRYITQLSIFDLL